ncbi:hypothetical protein MTO96_034483 [Rhipicephalus appendiculatus]
MFEEEEETPCACYEALHAEHEECSPIGFTEYLNVESTVRTCYADIDIEITARKTDLANNVDSDDEPSRAPFLADVIDALSVVRSYIECSNGNAEMLCLVDQLENMTFSAGNY